MKNLFKYRTYRQKFTTAAVCSVLIVLLLLLLTYTYSTSGWVMQSQAEALALFSESEPRLHAIGRLVDLQMNRIYADSALMKDLRMLMRSRTLEDYISARRHNSLATKGFIRSFPEDVRGHLYHYDHGLTRVELDNDEWLVYRTYSASSVQFSMPAAGGGHSDELEFRRTVYDPNNNFARVGDISFCYRRSVAFPNIDSDSFRFVGVVNSDNSIHMLKGNERDKSLLRDYLQAGEQDEALYDGFGNRLFFFDQESVPLGYRMVACIDDATMLSKWWSSLLFTFAIFGALEVAFLIFYSYTLRYNARFFNRILYVVDEMKRGYFPEPQKQDARRDSEYGIIAAELDDMSWALHRFITTEYQLKLKQQETDMRALQHQINPHFLYNTLESIRAMALMNQDRGTAEAIANLGMLYREIVKKQAVITMANELDLLEKYLKVMGTKYPDQFFYQFEIEPELLPVPTVKFWMQPLAENFFVHGFNEEQGYNLLIVSGRPCPGGYCIEVIDNGATLSPERLEELNRQIQVCEGEESKDSIGMSNVCTRLKYFYGDAFSMRIVNNTPSGIRIILTIPKQVAEG